MCDCILGNRLCHCTEDCGLTLLEAGICWSDLHHGRGACVYHSCCVMCDVMVDHVTSWLSCDVIWFSYDVTVLLLLAVSPATQDELQRYVLFARRFNPKVSEQLHSRLTSIEFVANRKRLLSCFAGWRTKSSYNVCVVNCIRPWSWWHLDDIWYESWSEWCLVGVCMLENCSLIPGHTQLVHIAEPCKWSWPSKLWDHQFCWPRLVPQMKSNLYRLLS